MLDGYDSWLSAPYQEAAAEGDAFIDFCEANGIDPDELEADAAWYAHLDDYDGPDPDDERDRMLEREHDGWL